jgi:hypothetical protein
MQEWIIALAASAVLLAVFCWWVHRQEQKGRTKGEIDQGLKRSAQTWKERHR